jgi:hypothetical protein
VKIRDTGGVEARGEKRLREGQAEHNQDIGLQVGHASVPLEGFTLM